MEKGFNKNGKKQDVSQWGFLSLSLYAFLGLGLELVVLLGESFIYKGNIGKWATWQNCLHWTLTCMVWISMVLVLLKVAKNQYDFDPFRFKRVSNEKGLGAALLIVIIGIVTMTLSWKGFKPWMELRNKSLVEFIFQYIYYFCETAIFSLIIIFGQQFGEEMTQNKKLPWGGLLLAITWGAVHILTQDMATGIESIIFSVLFGIIYLLMKKDIRWSYPLIACIFIV